MFSSKNIVRIMAAALVLITPLSVFAGGPGFGGNVADGGQCPIDGGLSLLVASGIGYGINKYRAKKAAKQNDAL
jgi:hypothetical protein